MEEGEIAPSRGKQQDFSERGKVRLGTGHAVGGKDVYSPTALSKSTPTEGLYSLTACCRNGPLINLKGKAVIVALRLRARKGHKPQ